MGLPAAFTPSWQLEHVPVTCAWSTRIVGFHAADVWQLSQRVVARDVARVLAQGQRAVVAREAGADHLCVIHLRRRLPACGRMTGLAGVARRQVTGVLARRVGAVVAAEAVAGDAVVAEPGGRLPRHRAVAHAALGRRGDVRRRFAGGLDVVVAARARALHLCVIDASRGFPGRHGVTGFAGR